MPDRDAIRARADLKQIEASIRRLHYYGDPPDVRLQQDVDGDVLDIMDRILATLATAEARYAALDAEIPEYRANLLADTRNCWANTPIRPRGGKHKKSPPPSGPRGKRHDI